MDKITRRAFLKLSGSAAGGALLARVPGNPPPTQTAQMPGPRVNLWRFPLRFPFVFEPRPVVTKG